MNEDNEAPTESDLDSEDSDSDSHEVEMDVQQEDISEEHNFQDENLLVNEKRYIVEESAILELIRNQRCRQTHCSGGIVPETIEKSFIPSGLKYTFKCNNGHEYKWLSSKYYGGRCFVHLLIQLAILVSGLTMEGVHLLFKTMNLALGSRTNFFAYQGLYARGIGSYFQDHIRGIQNDMKGKDVVLLVDTRYDSPGFCASMATTVFMDMETNKIINIEIGHKSEAGGSTKLEGFLFRRGMDRLIQNGLKIKEVVTDASRTFISILEQPEYQGIKHSLDVWHKAKKINEKLGIDSKKRQNKDIRPWIRHIVNHFWWCCTTAKGSVMKIRRKWLSILSHVRNTHEWTTGHCEHSQNCEPPKGCTWLTESSEAFKCLRSHVQDRLWCSSLRYYTYGRTTWRLENFNSHTLLRYCPKRLSFTFDGYTARNHLAALDYNHHQNRARRMNKEGDPIQSSQCSRRTKEWVAFQDMVEKDYSYIPGLISLIMRSSYGVTMKAAIVSDRAKEIRLNKENKKKCHEKLSRFH